MTEPTASEAETLAQVLGRIRRATAKSEMIRYDPAPGSLFSGTLGEFAYVFEGEDDLLHLAVSRLDGAPVSPEEGQAVAAVVLKGVAPGLVWFKPGARSQHFYLGHDDLP
ncbi:MAG: hypothetical protein KF884_05295 [Fimbriimonadaceae bacterium]|nr:hypothetical protein [Fimbriimonadaceae bacterium]QYK59499.1 MAG: hypothetical protein KF884_05295 [Fimbriimonadaceae bacterium]